MSISAPSWNRATLPDSYLSTPVTKTFPDGSKYEGEIRNGDPHGRGTLYYSEDDPSQKEKYEGGFEYGRPEGEGTMIWRNGAKYVGFWRAGKMDGRGVYTDIDQSVSAGNFVNGLLVTGKKTFANGKELEGTFKNGQFCDGVDGLGQNWEGGGIKKVHRCIIS